MVLIGQAALRSPAFDERLNALLTELQQRGCTVWLEGMTLRFDVPESQLAWVQGGGVGTLLESYTDVVLWLPTELPGGLQEGADGLFPVLQHAPLRVTGSKRAPRPLERWLKT